MRLKEKLYSPRWKDLTFRWYPNGKPLEVTDIVGLVVERNKKGYATRCLQSDGKCWVFPRDLEEFLYREDLRLLFIDGLDREMEPILKHLGEAVCRDLIDGYEVHGITYRGGVLRVKGSKSVWSLKPFYTSSMLPAETDCYGVQARGERLVQCVKASGLPLRLHSCGSMIDELPYMSAPAEAAEMAYNCYHGGWIEAMKLGHFSTAYDYDLSSAYPTEAASLISCSSNCGYWVDSSTYIADAYYGFCYCKVRLDISLPLTPLMVRVRSVMSPSGRWPIRIVRNPVGLWEGWLTKDEVAFIVTNCLGVVQILAGQWFIPERYHQVFAPIVSKLNVVRRRGERSNDELMKNLGKLTAAAIQGKMMQSFISNGIRVVGNAMNPVYAATLTARVRLKVAEIALENWDSILMVMVDGILSSSVLSVPKQWKLAHSGECVIANHGDYSIPGRKTASKLVHSLNIAPKDSSYRLFAPRYESLAEAIDAYSFEFACMTRPEARSKVRQVGKRYWETLPRTCEDLLTSQYDSTPLISSEHTKLELGASYQ